MKRETLKLTPEEGREIVYGENDDFTIIKEKIVNRTRWFNLFNVIVQRKSDGKFFSSVYRLYHHNGEDVIAYEFKTEALFHEVFPVEKTIIVYK